MAYLVKILKKLHLVKFEMKYYLSDKISNTKTVTYLFLNFILLALIHQITPFGMPSPQVQ